MSQVGIADPESALVLVDAERAKRLPRPVGPNMVVVLPKMKEQTKGGLHLANDYLRREEVAHVTALVVAMGPDCYKDTEAFPSGPWCKEGDWVVMRAYSGTRLRMDGADVELRIIKDNTIEAVVEDPTLVRRA